MTNKCMQCGRCSAACPMATEMDLPPHMWVYRINNGGQSSVQQTEAIWQCLSCFCCEARCPRGVKPAHLAEEARGGQGKFTNDKGKLLENISANANDKIPRQLLVAALRKAGEPCA
ncbi:MAG: 4Fe-4S dicluster domain-containing protein [Defluviitaleaceae bacterium]|nr:4Fe-4S dicluster domain-containing protein [Defluviitaleaceae bacterium]